MAPSTQDMRILPVEPIGAHSPWHNAWLELTKGYHAQACGCFMTEDHWIDMAHADMEDDSTIPCVVCMMAPQRGGTGCCSQECVEALEEAYPRG